MVETQLCELRVHVNFIYDMVFVNETCDVVVDKQMLNFSRKVILHVFYILSS